MEDYENKVNHKITGDQKELKNHKIMGDYENQGNY